MPQINDEMKVEYNVIEAMDMMKLGITMVDHEGRKWRYNDKVQVYLQRHPEEKVWVIKKPVDHGMYRWTQAREQVPPDEIPK